MSEPSAFAVVYSTFPDAAAAEAAARRLVEQRLAACIHMIPGMRSVYRWQGAVETAEEIVFLVKTRSELADAVMAAIAAEHPYEVPALVALPLSRASAAYGAWILAETKPLD